MRRAARTDANQTKIVQELRDIGATVVVTSMVGAGFPDIVVGFRGENYLMEIKDGGKPPSKRRLTPAEQKFFETWRGTVIVIKDVEEALKAIGAI